MQHDLSTRFRAHLLRRLLLVAGLASSAAVAACSDEVSHDDDGGGGAGAATTNGPSTSSGWDGTWCMPLGSGGAGGTSAGGTSAGGTSAGGTSAGGTSAGGTSARGGSGGAPGSCPSKEQAGEIYTGGACGIGSILDGPFVENGQCCYAVHEESCVTGRPFLDEGAPLLASLAIDRDDWIDRDALPDTSALDARQLRMLSEAWSADARGEHASVASFARFALELLACGAPPDLVAAAQRAALDEIGHARACFRLASAYAGRALGPGPLPLRSAVEVSSDRADVAARVVVEGCVGETLAALQAAEQLAAATDPAVRAVLALIAEEEAQHAELAWQTVAWALAEGGDRVRHAVAHAFRHALASMADAVGDALEGSDPQLAAHGRLDADRLRAVRRRGLEEVVRPCAEALLRLPCRPHRGMHGTIEPA